MQAEHESDLRRKGLHVVASVPARPSPLGDLEQLFARSKLQWHERRRSAEGDEKRDYCDETSAAHSHSSQQEFDVMHDVIGGLSEGYEQAQLALAVDQKDRGGMMDLVSESFILRRLAVDRDAIRLTHGS